MQSGRVAGYTVNGLLRASIALFLAHALRHPDDPRYAGKAIPVRNLLIVGSLSLVFPLLSIPAQRRRTRARSSYNQDQATDSRWAPWMRWQRYPVWTDNLYLSIFWLDMAGNFFNLYDRYTHFDLIPHFHGSGALAGVLLSAFEAAPLVAFGAANGIHALLEAQEYLTDVFFGTHNVRGAWDSAGDLSAGLLGTLAYVLMASLTQRPPHERVAD